MGPPQLKRPPLGITSRVHMKRSQLLPLAACLAWSPLSGALAAQAAPVRTVERLYRAFAWEAIFSAGTAGRTPGFTDQSRAALENYLTPDLAQLIVADRECAARSHEICKLDYLPLWDSQDPLVSDLTILATRDSTAVEVEYRTGDGTHTVKITYHLMTTPLGWRIADILYRGGRSLKAELSAR